MCWIASRATGYYYVSGKKSGIQETDEKRTGCGILGKKGRECEIRTPPPFQTLNYVPLLFDCTHEREVKLELLTLSVCNVSLMATESSVWIHYGCLISINLAFSKVPFSCVYTERLRPKAQLWLIHSIRDSCCIIILFMWFIRLC